MTVACWQRMTLIAYATRYARMCVCESVCSFISALLICRPIPREEQNGLSNLDYSNQRNNLLKVHFGALAKSCNHRHTVLCQSFVKIKLFFLPSLCLCFCLILSVGKVVLRKIAVLWDQYHADTSLALSKNLYQAKTHLQRGSNGSQNHYITLAQT